MKITVEVDSLDELIGLLAVIRGEDKLVERIVETLKESTDRLRVAEEASAADATSPP